ncbi:ABC transporter permease [Mumia zhuanghuii]|uniref:ABC transporter permease n=2 Tax=Mumia zhuanghuii TaxID=2585211 RepID=A0A5C4MJI9_9ACTN|nr:ABC transporter permease [Mumia zhuanghuii]TNC44152.1 ABC transporter permease [Mumia zhuanghuii]
MSLWEYVQDRWSLLSFQGYQHVSLVVQSLLLATLVALAVACIAYRSRRITDVALSLSSVGLTLPAFALFGILIAFVPNGIVVSVAALAFYGTLPILRNAVVGLSRVDPALVESARGMGMSRTATLLRLEIPLAWPVIVTGIRVSAQMLMGIAAIAAYVSGPGLGSFIFSGLSRIGGANATNSAWAGTLAIVVLAVLLDLVLSLLGRLTTSRGIRV